MPSEAWNEPHDIELEGRVLGIIMSWGETFPIAAAILNPDDFYLRDSWGFVFEVMGELHAAGTPPDVTSVLGLLRQRNQLSKTNGAGTLLGLVRGAPGPDNLEHYCRTLVEQSSRREIMRVCRTAVRDCALQTIPPSEILVNAARQFDAVSSRGIRENEVQVMQEVAQDEAQRLDTLYRSGPAMQGIPTAWGWLDEASGGYAPGDLWVWAARPNTGKSRLAIYSLGMAAKAGAMVGLISLDMGHGRLMQYLMPQLANINGESIHAGQLYRPYSWGDTDTARLYDTCRAVDPHRRFWLTSKPRGNRLSNVEGYVRQMKRMGCDVIAVDQAQNIGGWESGGKDRSLYPMIVGSMKRMAQLYEVTIIVLHQVQRAGAGAPTLANLKDTGCWEEFSDMVVLLHDPERAMMEQHGEFVNDGKTVRAPRRDGKTPDADAIIQTNVNAIRPVRIELAKNRNDAIRREYVQFDYARGVSV